MFYFSDMQADDYIKRNVPHLLSSVPFFLLFIPGLSSELSELFYIQCIFPKARTRAEKPQLSQTQPCLNLINFSLKSHLLVKHVNFTFACSIIYYFLRLSRKTVLRHHILHALLKVICTHLLAFKMCLCVLNRVHECKRL